MLKAVIFDMDGVIIDSEPMHAKAALLTLQKYNAETTLDYINKFIGSTTYYMCQKMVDDFHLEITPAQLLQSNVEMKALLLKAEGHIVVPYVINFIKDLYDHGINLCIASSSSPEEIEEVMDSLGIRKYFCGYVSGVNVAHPKPAPDIFLKAAERLDANPDECLIIEDSGHGVTAACAAGITCIGYINPNSGNQDLSKAALLVEGFEEVDYSFTQNFYEEMNPSGIIFTTKQFIIRELTLSDMKDMFQIYRQPAIREYLDNFTDNYELELKKHEDYINNVYRYYGFGLWGVFLKENGILIGKCGIELNKLEDEAVYEIGYLLSTPYQGTGYATKFVKSVLDYCRNTLKIQKIVAVIDKENKKSIRLAERVGMRKINECIRNQRNCYIYVAD